jgi:hypothetical protein
MLAPNGEPQLGQRFGTQKVQERYVLLHTLHNHKHRVNQDSCEHTIEIFHIFLNS